MQEAGALEYVPTGHVEAVYAQEEAPAGLYVPAGQGMHVEGAAAPKEVL